MTRTADEIAQAHKACLDGANTINSVIATHAKGSDAVKMTKILSKKHGIFVGISAGANIFASIEISKKMPAGSKIVTILCDTGERYLSTGIFS